MAAMRTEQDSLGTIEVPVDAYYGAFTQRAKENFPAPREEMPHVFIGALARVKKAAAQANKKLGTVEKEKADAIVNAAEELARGKFDDSFVLGFFQAGAGTPFHMNVNEILANRASELLGSSKGDYYVDPHDDVNYGQSSNNVIPTAVRIAALELLDKLEHEVEHLAAIFSSKANAYENVVKAGRTHLQDATPITYGQVFDSYAAALRKRLAQLERAEEELKELGIGGTALGTGLNAHPQFAKRVVKNLSKELDHDFEVAESGPEVTWSMAAFTQLSGALETLSVTVDKIADDLRLLSAGPRTAINEITLPKVEEGSSIMPGKINPSVPECMSMICLQVRGNHKTIVGAGQRGELELNVFAPVIAKNLFASLELLRDGLEMFREKCVEGLTVNEAVCREHLEKSASIVTALNPYLGYDAGAKVVEIALREEKRVREVILEHNLMTEAELNRVLDPETLTRAHEPDEKLAKDVQERDAYDTFRKEYDLA